MKKIITLIICLVVSSCGSVSLKPDGKKYSLLFNKDLAHGCVSGFDSENMLYLVSRLSTNRHYYYVSVYDPRTSLYANVILKEKGSNCKDIDLSTAKTQDVARLNFIEDGEFRKLFNNYNVEPIKLSEAITDGPIYFRYDGKWLGKRTALNIERRKVKGVNRISEITNHMKKITRYSAESMMAVRVNEVKRIEEMKNISKKTKKLLHNQVREKKDMWKNRMGYKLSLGDKVCTYKENLFGYVEGVHENKVKVFMRGKMLKTPNGFFFGKSYPHAFEKKIESIRWVSRSELALCEFSN